MEIRYFNINETKELQKGINDIWSANHIFVKEKKLLHYMFSDNPSRNLLVDDNHYSFIGAWENEKLIGLLGVMPFVLNVYGKKESGFCLTNWIVSPDFRKTGAGLSLMREVQNHNPSIILSLGINKNVAKLYKMMRWNVLDDSPRWIGIVNKEKTIKKMLKGDEEPLRYWKEVNEVHCIKYIASEETRLNESTWNQFYWNDFAKKTVGFARDYSFINWRYLKNPFFNYRILLCTDNSGEYKGLAVVRIEDVLDGEKIGRIVEFIASDQDSAIVLANAVINLDQDVLFYDFYCFSSVSSWGLEAVGFKKVLKSKQENIVVPSRFQPLDLDVTNLMASMYTTPEFKKKFNFIKENSWYVTKGDSDQDRPN